MATRRRTPQRPAPPKRRAGSTLIQRSRTIAPSEKAAYQTGEGRVLRDFFGFSEADETALVETFQTGLERLMGAA